MASEGKEKKRKATNLDGQANPQVKKSKKSAVDNNTAELKNKATVVADNITSLSTLVSSSLSQPKQPSIVQGNDAVLESKKSRKRAADFLNEDTVSTDVVSIKTIEVVTVSTGINGKPKKKAKKDKTKDKPVDTVTNVTDKSVVDQEANLSTQQETKSREKKVKDKLRPANGENADSKGEAELKPVPKKSNPSTVSFHINRLDQLLDSGYLKWPEPKKARNQQKTKVGQQSLTADGVNGIVEHSSEEDVQTLSANNQTSMSLQAEAQRTVDQELNDEYKSEEEVSEDEADDQGAALLAGFDSDSEDLVQDGAEVTDPVSTFPLPKKASKKIAKAIANGNSEGPGTVYIGRIPHGFFEHQMRAYFSQFGTITKLRLSRNRRTGASKHFAFVQFESADVAKIVASVMDNYLMFGHILKCKFAPEESLHPDTWKGANKRFKKVPYTMLEKKKLESPKTKEKWEKKTRKEQKKREAKAEKYREMGYEIELPKMKLPGEVLEQKKLQAVEEQRLPEAATEVTEPVGALEPPPGIPKDEVAMEESKKTKKIKKPEASKASKAVQMAEAVPTDIVDAAGDELVAEPEESKEDKKATKKRKSKHTAGEATAIQPAEVETASTPVSEVPAIESSKSKKDGKKQKRENKKALEAQLSAQLNNEMQATTSKAAPVPTNRTVLLPVSDDADADTEAAAPTTADKKKSRKRRKRSGKDLEDGGVALPMTEPEPKPVALTVAAPKAEKKEKTKKQKLEGESASNVKSKHKKTKVAV